MKFLGFLAFCVIALTSCTGNNEVSGKVSGVSYENNIELGNHTVFDLTADNGEVIHLASPGHSGGIKNGMTLSVIYKKDVVSVRLTSKETKNPDGSVAVSRVNTEYWLLVGYKVRE